MIATADGCEVKLLVQPNEKPTVANLTSTVEYVAWSPSGHYAVVADSSGRLNFMLRDGRILFSHPLVQRPTQGAGSSTS